MQAVVFAIMAQAELAVRVEIQAAIIAFPISELLWSSSADLVAAASANKAVLQRAKDSFHDINVDATFRDLVQVGNLLQVALTAAGNQKCSKPILQIMSAYQDVVVLCVQTSGSFENACVGSLRIHKLVKKAFEKKKIDFAFKKYGECAALANTMADGARELANRVEVLKKHATDALVLAKDDMVDNEKAQQDVEELMRTLKGQEAFIKSTLDSLTKELEEARAEEIKFATQAQEERDRAHKMAMVGAIVGGVSGILNAGMSRFGGGMGGNGGDGKGGDGEGDAKRRRVEESPAGVGAAALAELKDAARETQANLTKLKRDLSTFKETQEASTDDGKRKIKDMEDEIAKKQVAAQDMSSKLQQASAQNAANADTLAAKEAAATSRKRDLLSVQREQTARLKQSVQEMEGMTKRETKIQQTLKCLGITLQTMGRVKTTFSTVELFWRSVAQQCEALGKMKDQLQDEWAVADDDERELDPFDVIKQHFQESAVNWAALGFVNHKAHLKMSEAMESVNQKMCALPDGKVDGALVDKMAREMTASFEADEALLDK